MNDKARMLAGVPLFARLSGQALDRVASLTDEVDVGPGTQLTTEGRPGGEFFVILNGAVEVTRGGQSLRTLGSGDFLGEIALVDGGLRTATATTTTASRLLVLAPREFHTLLSDHAEVRQCVLQALAQRVRNLDTQAVT
jgi:CRP-like cAMP-binding protein